MSSSDKGGAYSFNYDLAQDWQPVIAIVEAVSWATGRDNGELEPLHEAIDVDALRAIFAHSAGSPDRDRAIDDGRGLTVTFRYEGFEVVVGIETITLKSN